MVTNLVINFALVLAYEYIVVQFKNNTDMMYYKLKLKTL